MRLVALRDFQKAFAALSKDKQRAAERALEKLASMPPAASLKLRRFQGSDDLWIANINRGDRIFYRLLQADTAELLDIGTHDATYAKWNRRT